MDAHVAQELLNELGSSLENLETQQAALLRFLKDKGIVTDEQLAPYLHEAGNASSVRWRAAHVRLEHIFSAAEQKEQQTAKPEERQAAGTPPPNQQKDNEEKLAKSSMTQDANEKALTKEEKTESPATRAQTPAGGTKAHEKVPSAQRREEDAA